MSASLRRAFAGGLLLFPLSLSSCYVPLEEGQRMQQQIEKLQQGSQQSREELSSRLQKQSDELNKLLDEARRLTTSLADSSQKSDKLQGELIQFQGRIEENQRALDALQKQFGEYRAHSDTQLEQLSNTIATIKNPPLPDNPDALFSEAERKLLTKEYNEARRRYDAFLNRYPQDARAAKAQLNIGEAYFQEAKYANALIALRKVIDNHAKSDEVEQALYRSGHAFQLIKKCSEARTFFQELLRLYPRTRLKNDVNEQLKELTRNAKNKQLCET